MSDKNVNGVYLHLYIIISKKYFYCGEKNIKLM